MPDDHARLREAARERVGRVLSGKYRLDAMLGCGGAAAVYAAWNTTVQRPCAVKVLHAPLRADAEAVERFRREAFAANRVTYEGHPHPNVVDILDAGEDEEGAPYLVQELLRGETLAELLERSGEHRLDLATVVTVMRPVMHAIATGHTVGVVHRDIKPDNIYLVDRQHLGRPPLAKILDFGIAQLEDSRITQGGSFHGTPSYIPPEGYTDPNTIDARLDVWALGLTLHEALTGANPFWRPGAPWYEHAALVQTTDAPSLATLGVPAPLRAVVRRALSRDPARRFPDAGAMLSAFDHALAPANVFDLRPGESVADAIARLRLSETAYNGVRVHAPWQSVSEIVSFLSQPELSAVRTLALTDTPAIDGVRIAPRPGSGPGPVRAGAGDEMASALAQCSALANLVALEIAGGGLTDAGVRALLTPGAFPGLAALSLARNRVGDAGAAALAGTTALRELEALDLADNDVGDVGARALATSDQLAVLGSLDLAGNHVSDEGALALAESRALAVLVSVNLDRNRVSDDAVRYLRGVTERMMLV